VTERFACYECGCEELRFAYKDEGSWKLFCGHGHEIVPNPCLELTIQQNSAPPEPDEAKRMKKLAKKACKALLKDTTRGNAEAFVMVERIAKGEV
jgi:hypothetical protein